MHNNSSKLIRDKVSKSWLHRQYRDPLKKVKIIKTTMSKQFKINNYNCSTNNYKIRQRQLWNQSSTSSSSRRNNNPHYPNSSNPKAQIPPWPHWYLSRYSACKSRWRRALGWCAIRSTWSREGLRMRRVSSRCWRGSRAITKIGKCNVILRNLSNLGDSLTPSISSSRPCVIRSWEWARSQITNFYLNNNRWWGTVQQINNTTKEVIDKTDGYSKIHQTCYHLSTTINRSEMHARRARSKSRRPSNRSWLLCGQKF
jgi:hypothetical protein